MAQKRNYATKKKGDSTRVDPFWNYADIKGVMDWFISHGQYENHLIFMFGLLMGRRIGDTLSIKWENLYNKKGELREELHIKEQKTGKTSEIFISPMMGEAINLYLKNTNKTPLDDYNGFVFTNESKQSWVARKNDPFYKNKSNDIEVIKEWRRFRKNDISDKKIDELFESFKKQLSSVNKRKAIYKNLTDYLYNYVEYMAIVKSQQNKYRVQLLLATDETGITYPVSTHSTRKTFGRITKMIHPNDIYCMQTLQDMLEHATEGQTRTYIGISKEKKKEFYNDIGNVIQRVANGEEDILIDNSPIISFTHEDLRKILMYCIKSEESEIEVFNNAMTMVDQFKLKNV